MTACNGLKEFFVEVELEETHPTEFLLEQRRIDELRFHESLQQGLDPNAANRIFDRYVQLRESNWVPPNQT